MKLQPLYQRMKLLDKMFNKEIFEETKIGLKKSFSMP